MSRRILAVDDEIHMLRLLERTITENTPYHITTTNNSLAIQTILEQEQFSVIITDLRMPGWDGLDILRWIKDNNRTEEVIIITAFGSPESSKEALTYGAFDYITKPFRKEDILFVVNRAMRCYELRSALAEWMEILDREPYDQAARAFQDKYIRHLAARAGTDRQRMAERSGLSIETLAAALGDQPTENL